MNSDMIFDLLISVIGYCQREEILSSDEKLYSELADISDFSEEDLKELLE